MQNRSELKKKQKNALTTANDGKRKREQQTVCGALRFCRIFVCCIANIKCISLYTLKHTHTHYTNSNDCGIECRVCMRFVSSRHHHHRNSPLLRFRLCSRRPWLRAIFFFSVPLLSYCSRSDGKIFPEKEKKKTYKPKIHAAVCWRVCPNVEHRKCTSVINFFFFLVHFHSMYVRIDSTPAMFA